MRRVRQKRKRCPIGVWEVQESYGNLCCIYIYIHRYSFEFHQKPLYILLDIQTASVFEVVVGYDVAPKQMPLLD